ncbi:hypothetical protein [Flagellimonas sp.]|uniref:hypothetical protein n=1 Tax=Flagellimonas sp. TaxID=2058762 RepID=UPI003B5B4292
MKTSLFLAIILILSCKDNLEKKETSISGKLVSSNSKIIYLNVIDHFDYFNDGYIVDSTTVAANGEFRFNRRNLESKLVSLTTEKFKPITYQIFRNAPQTYYFGSCEKFFTNTPFFYITKEESIHIDWYKNKSVDSISSPDNSGFLQVKMREFYLSSKVNEVGNLDYDSKQNIETNWEQMLVERNHDLKAINLDNANLENSFDNYLYTEIYLGHLNQFLNWFEEYYPEKVEAAINNSELKNVYSSVFSEYRSHRWNSKSLEYYKFTERYVNHHMNIQSKSFEHYYTPSEKKRKLAQQVLSDKNKERYLSLIDEQMKNLF